LNNLTLPAELLGFFENLPSEAEIALRQALSVDLTSLKGIQKLGDGAHISTILGAGSNSVYTLHANGVDYCLKLIRKKSPAVVIREIGGLCLLKKESIGRAGIPYAFGVSPPHVVSEFLPGNSLGNQHLSSAQLQELATASKELYVLTPDHSGLPMWDIDWSIRQSLVNLQNRLDQLTSIRTEGIVSEAVRLIKQWLCSTDPEILFDVDRLVFSRGDQNLANCLWDGEKIRFVDFEDCGWNDLALDLSLLTEHIQSYGTPIEAWNSYIDLFDLSATEHRRLMAARCRVAFEWLSMECLKPCSLHSFPEENRLEVLFTRAVQICRLQKP
jgi:thiamine kinase-like enzyme